MSIYLEIQALEREYKRPISPELRATFDRMDEYAQQEEDRLACWSYDRRTGCNVGGL